MITTDNLFGRPFFINSSEFLLPKSCEASSDSESSFKLLVSSFVIFF